MYEDTVWRLVGCAAAVELWACLNLSVSQGRQGDVRGGVRSCAPLWQQQQQQSVMRCVTYTPLYGSSSIWGMVHSIQCGPELAITESCTCCVMLHCTEGPLAHDGDGCVTAGSACHSTCRPMLKQTGDTKPTDVPLAVHAAWHCSDTITFITQ